MKYARIVLVQTAGYADVARKIPITKDTAFELASCTKQFTAAAIMQLAEQGE